MFMIAEIFSGLASMLRWLMMKPSSFPKGTPKTHSAGFNFHLKARRLAKVSSKSATKSSEFLILTTTSST